MAKSKDGMTDAKRKVQWQRSCSAAVMKLVHLSETRGISPFDPGGQIEFADLVGKLSSLLRENEVRKIRIIIDETDHKCDTIEDLMDVTMNLFTIALTYSEETDLSVREHNELKRIQKIFNARLVRRNRKI